VEIDTSASLATSSIVGIEFFISVFYVLAMKALS